MFEREVSVPEILHYVFKKAALSHIREKEIRIQMIFGE